MRITGGTLCGRTFKAPEGLETRPTTDRVREALFNILAHRDWGEAIGDPLDQTVVLDAFCGTGALAFESLSWGAKTAFLFDQNQKPLTIAKENAEKLGVTNACSFLAVDALCPPVAKVPCQLVFLDPPYKKGLIAPTLVALESKGWLSPGALVVSESSKKEEIVWPDFMHHLHTRTYGDTALHFCGMVG